MTKQQFIDLFESHSSEAVWEGDNAYQGLQIIAKYINPMTECLINGASRDEIYSVCIDALCATNITEEDVIVIAMLNWSITDNEYLSCFV